MKNTEPAPRGDNSQAHQKNSVPTSGNWYAVTACYKLVPKNAGRLRHHWQRSVFLIRAKSDQEADEKADSVACRLMDGSGEELDMGYAPADWVFQSVENIVKLLEAEISDGREVYWEFWEQIDRKTSPP